MSSAYNKTVVAAILAILTLLDLYFGVSFGWLTEDWLIALFAVLSPILIYFTPNRPMP